jgi:DNA-binding transcriptional regulator YiaG
MSRPWFQTRVKRLREKLRLTQVEFAKRLGVTTLTVNRWERGHTYPKGLSLVVLDGLERETLS